MFWKNTTCGLKETRLLRLVNVKLYLCGDDTWSSCERTMKKGNGNCDCWHYHGDI